MRILITGGAGFIGSHLSDRLIAAKHEVVALDNFFTGSRSKVSRLLGNPHFDLVRHDVTFPFHVQAERIFNLACPASPVHYQFNPVKTIRTSVLGMLNCLDLAKENNARVLQASTSEVYGDPTVHPQTESYWGHVNPIGPRACYDEGKRCAEALMVEYARQERVEIRIARIFNTYGPRMSFGDGRVVSNFIIQALRGEDITVYGDGSQTRSFCYVDDLVDGLMRLMDRPSFDGPVNLGNPVEHTMVELAEIIIRLTGSKSRLVFRPLPSDDPKQRCPDITKAKSLLGFAPVTPVEEGLARTIQNFRGRLEAGETN
ncbi:MAG: SDR family oxidoreductase [Deltaproteobacteria bacterium]|nr:SDR family oxidoreductase [Deltaproteobacteria bacterium]